MNGDLKKADEAAAFPAETVGVGVDGGGLTEGEGGATGTRVKVQPDVEERKLRAFRVYLELLDTGEWLRRQFAEQLEGFDLTIDGFRLLEILYREGAITTEEFCKRRRCRRQAFDGLLKPLEERGWVQYEVIELEPAEIDEAQLAKKLRGLPRRGRRMGRVKLTEDGRNFMHVVFPRHAKLVFAFMRALDAREQETIAKACRKLREGDVVRLLDEITMEEVE